MGKDQKYDPDHITAPEDSVTDKNKNQSSSVVLTVLDQPQFGIPHFLGIPLIKQGVWKECEFVDLGETAVKFPIPIFFFCY